MLKIAAICKKKHLTPFLNNCCCCTDVFVQYRCIDIFCHCLEVINGCRLDTSNLEFDPPPQKVAEVVIRGMQRPRNFQQSQNDSFSFEQVQDGLGAVSSCTILLPDIDLTNDRWIASSQTRSWTDHQRYRLHQCWPAHFLHHPFHNQPISIHEPNKLMSSPCYSPVSNMPPCLQDTMAPKRCHIFNFGLGWRGYHLSSLSRSGARRFCLQMVTILSTFWHPCRLEISQNQVDFFTVSKIGPC